MNCAADETYVDIDRSTAPGLGCSRHSEHRFSDISFMVVLVRFTFYQPAELNLDRDPLLDAPGITSETF